MKTRRLVSTLFLGLALTLATLRTLAIPRVLAADIGVTIFTDGGAGSLRAAISTANGNVEDDTITLPAGTYTLTLAGTGEDSNATGDLDITSSDTLTITGAGAENTIINANGIDRVLHIHAGTVVISGVTIYNGSSTGANNGGGIYNAGADLTLINTRVYGNSAYNGGGVYVSSGNATLTGTRVLNNSASTTGGGVYVYQGIATLTGTQVFNNSASYGGGVYVTSGSATLNVSGGMIDSNSASDGGGGVYVSQGSATLNETQVFSNSASSGGGVFIDQNSAALNVSGGMIDSNSASHGGGGVFILSGNVTLSGTQVFSNSAFEDGGGVFVTMGNATLNVSGGMIDNNSASTNGGGVCVWDGSATLTGTQVAGNSASHGGGGVYVSSGSATLNVSGGIIDSNSASFGGGVHISQGSATLTGTQVVSNSASTYGYGGGVFVNDDSATLNVSGGMIDNNSASYGGGVCILEGSATLNGTQVLNNSASYGGGIYVYYGNATLAGTQITANNAITGSALYTGGTITATTALTITGDVYQWGGRFAGSSHDLHITGSLRLAGGDFYAPDAPRQFTLTGPFSHTAGSYHQARDVSGSDDVGFPKVGGLILNANDQSLGSTTVTITAGADCAGVPVGAAVQHCYDISPDNASGRDATLTLFYQSGEIPAGHACAAMEAYRWTGAWDSPLTRDVTYGSAGRLCGPEPQSLRATGVSTFSLFVLRGPVPEITVTPLSLAFGDQEVDAGATLSQTVTITNDGSADLHISAIAPTGDTGEFNLADSGEATLTPGDTRAITVSFDPSGVGAKAVTLTIQSDDSDESTVEVSLSGTGVTQPVIATPPVLVSPADGTLTSTTSLTLTWQAVTGADGYWLDWNGTVSDRGDVTEYATGVLADGTYTWTVAAYNALNTSAYTGVWSFGIDATAPTVTLVSPADGASEVVRNAPIVVNFSEAMATVSVSYTIAPTATGLAPVWGNGDRRLRLAHDELAANTRYTVSVDTGSDPAGNPLGNAPYTWVFTTGAVSAPEADLSLDKVRVGTGDVSAGERITYTFTITNAGPTGPVTATLVDTFSDATALAGVGGTGCAWTPGESDVTCTVTNVIDETTASLTLVVTTSSAYSGTLSNSASVSPAGGVVDPNGGNDDAGPVYVIIKTGGYRYIYLPLVVRNN